MTFSRPMLEKCAFNSLDICHTRGKALHVQGSCFQSLAAWRVMCSAWQCRDLCRKEVRPVQTLHGFPELLTLALSASLDKKTIGL